MNTFDGLSVLGDHHAPHWTRASKYKNCPAGRTQPWNHGSHARQARQGCYRRWRRVCAGGLKKSLRHHPQGHNNTSSHARDEVFAMLHLRRAAVVCLLIPNFLAIRICGSSADSFWQCLSLLSRFTHVRASRRLWFFRTPSSVVEAKK